MARFGDEVCSPSIHKMTGSYSIPGSSSVVRQTVQVRRGTVWRGGEVKFASGPHPGRPRLQLRQRISESTAPSHTPPDDDCLKLSKHRICIHGLIRHVWKRRKRRRARWSRRIHGSARNGDDCWHRAELGLDWPRHSERPSRALSCEPSFVLSRTTHGFLALPSVALRRLRTVNVAFAHLHIMLFQPPCVASSSSRIRNSPSLAAHPRTTR
jgi:hypothetical protein